MNKKLVLIVAACAIALILLSVLGIDEVCFKNRVNITQLKKPYMNLERRSLVTVDKLTSRLPSTWPQSYVVTKEDQFNIVARNEDAVSGSEEEQLTRDFFSLKLSGIMRGAHGEYVASVNGSLARVGSMVSGCKVLSLGPDQIEFSANDKSVVLKLNEEKLLRKWTVEKLDLTDIFYEEGILKVVINGDPYRSGDLIDSETRVQSITPKKVVIMRAGSMMILSL